MLSVVCQDDISHPKDHQHVTLACIAIRLRHKEWSGCHAPVTGLSLAQALQVLCLEALHIKLALNCNETHVQALQASIKSAVACLHGGKGTPSDLGILRARVPQLLRIQTQPAAAALSGGAQV